MQQVVPFRFPTSQANQPRLKAPVGVSKFGTTAASDKRGPIALILATLLLILAQLAPAAPVTFWFTGIVEYTNDPSGTMPSGIAIGTPFAGKVTYDGDYIHYHSISGGGAVGDYYFKKLEGFSAHIQVGSHTLTNAILSDFGWSGNMSVYDNYQGSDELIINIGQAGLMVDGQPHTNSIFELFLSDRSQSAQNSIALPIQPPTSVAFPDGHQLTWTEDDGHGQSRFDVSGTITKVSAQPLVLLNLRRLDPDHFRISWPLAVTGGVLQWSDLVIPGDWHNVGKAVVADGMENAVILPSEVEGRLFRLVLP